MTYLYWFKPEISAVIMALLHSITGNVGYINRASSLLNESNADGTEASLCGYLIILAVILLMRRGYI